MSMRPEQEAITLRNRKHDEDAYRREARRLCREIMRAMR